MPSFPFCGTEGVFVFRPRPRPRPRISFGEDEDEDEDEDEFFSALVSQPKPFREFPFAEAK